MGGLELLQQTIDTAQRVVPAVPESRRQEMALLIKDLEDAKMTVFVRTAEARPMIERCARAAQTLKEVIDAGGWSDQAAGAFEELDRAVGKLRSTILVRTQRAT